MLTSIMELNPSVQRGEEGMEKNDPLCHASPVLGGGVSERTKLRQRQVVVCVAWSVLYLAADHNRMTKFRMLTVYETKKYDDLVSQPRK